MNAAGTRAHLHLAQPADGNGEGAGDRRRGEAGQGIRLGVGTNLTHSLSSAIRLSMSAIGTSLFSLMVSAWLWQRMAPTRTQMPSTGIGVARAENLVGLGESLPFLAALAVSHLPVDPGEHCSRQGIAEFLLRSWLAAQGWRRPSGRCRGWPTPDSASSATEPCRARPSASSSSRMLGAPAPEAAW